YCGSHLLRVNRREGTFEVAPDGGPKLSSQDVASVESGILLGRGWFTPERLGPLDTFRWAEETAEVLIPAGAAHNSSLVLDLEPGPASLGDPLELQVETEHEKILARVTVESRCRLQVPLPAPRPARLIFRALGEFSPVNYNTRTLCFRVFRLGWGPETASAAPATVAGGIQPRWFGNAWRSLQHLIAKLAHEAPLVTLTVPVSPRLRRILKFYVDRGGLTGILLGRSHEPKVDAAASRADEVPRNRPQSAHFLHTNASGDFQLAAREHWFNLRGYAEFDMYSMNIDSLFSFTAQYGGLIEEFLGDPMRIYHI